MPIFMREISYFLNMLVKKKKGNSYKKTAGNDLCTPHLRKRGHKKGEEDTQLGDVCSLLRPIYNRYHRLLRSVTKEEDIKKKKKPATTIVTDKEERQRVDP